MKVVSWQNSIGRGLRILQISTNLSTSRPSFPQLPPICPSQPKELMDQHGIGTDASIPQHIQTIQDRRYVQLVDGQGQPIVATHRGGPQGPKGPKGQRAPKRAPGRFLVPTARGLALVRGHWENDESNFFLAIDFFWPKIDSLHVPLRIRLL